MPQFTISIEDRIRAGFGFVPTRATGEAANNVGGFLNVEAFDPEPAMGKSLKGKPVFDVLEFYTEAGVQVYSFELPPFLDYSFSKVINSTVVNEDGGEVVESFGNSNWSIRIRGILVDMENHRQPNDQISALREACQKNMILQVSSSLLNNALGVTHLHITDFDGNTLEGFKDTVPFTISAKSIVPVDFLLFTPNP